MQRLYKIGGVVAISCWLVSSPAQAQTHESLSGLDKKLAEFLGNEQGAVDGARGVIDRRLKLRKCPEALQMEKRSEGLAIIKCTSLNWRISVPLTRQSHGSHRVRQSQMMVKRGQPVLLVARKSGFLVSRQMQADRGGRLGEIIPVRATRKSRPILAEIVGQGRVALPVF